CRQGLDPHFVAPPLSDGELFECLVDVGSLHERRDSYQQFAGRRVATLEEGIGRQFELGIVIEVPLDGALDTPFPTPRRNKVAQWSDQGRGNPIFTRERPRTVALANRQLGIGKIRLGPPDRTRAFGRATPVPLCRLEVSQV